MSNKLRSATELETVLGCGPYQIFMFIMYQLGVLLQCSNMVFMSFGKVAPVGWLCYTANSSNYSYSNFTEDSPTEEEKCELLANGSCVDLYWETDFYSIVPQWHLVCDRTGLVYLIMSVQMVGVLIGSPIFGQISDAYGRKWTLFFSHLSLVVLDAFSVFSPSWVAFLVFRFFIGLACGGTITITYVFMTEVLKTKHRLWVTTIAGWPPSFGVFAGLAYITKDWQRLSLAMAAVGVPPLIMLPFTVESPRWQLQKEKLDEAERGLERIVRWNRETEEKRGRVTHVVGGFQQIQHPLWTKQNGKRYSYWHLCQTRKMTKNIAVVVFAYVSVSMITYGVILNNDKLVGDKYLNFLIFSCIRWIASMLTPVADASIKRCGRKLTTAVSFAVICICTTSISLVLLFGSESALTGKIINGLVLVSGMLVSPIWASLNLISVEAFPTPVRNIAVGVTGVFTRLGSAIVPVFLYMSELWAPSPYVMFAVLALLASILCGTLLPETKGKPMPDSMPQAEEHWWCCCRGGQTERRQRPQGTTRSNSFTVYHFTSTQAA